MLGRWKSECLDETVQRRLVRWILLGHQRIESAPDTNNTFLAFCSVTPRTLR